MKLTDLDPRWIHTNIFAFRCPHCRDLWLTCKTAPMSGMAQLEIVDKSFGEDESHTVAGTRPDAVWNVSTGDFVTMTVTPSIDASASGHWHGFITGGEIK